MLTVAAVSAMLPPLLDLPEHSTPTGSSVSAGSGSLHLHPSRRGGGCLVWWVGCSERAAPTYTVAINCQNVVKVGAGRLKLSSVQHVIYECIVSMPPKDVQIKGCL